MVIQFSGPSDGVLSVRLRPLSLPDDVELALPWYADTEALYFSEGPEAKPFDGQRLIKMYEWLSRQGQVFIIEVMEERWTAIGDATLCEGMIPIVIGDGRYRGRGIGSHVLALLIQEARLRGWEKLVAHKIYSYNTRSRKLFEKHGFIRMNSGVDENGTAYHRYEKRLL